jgi:hypothetical protein
MMSIVSDMVPHVCSVFNTSMSFECSELPLLFLIACIGPLYLSQNVRLFLTDYGLDDRGVGVLVPVGSRIFSYPRHTDRLWCPSNLLSNGYREDFFSGGKAAGA